MNFKIKLDFCVIPSPYNKGLRNLLFISYAGANRVDEKLCLEEDYENVKSLLSQYGYSEIDFCVYESSDNSQLSMDELKQELVCAGMRYSKPFEFNIAGELESFNSDLFSQQNNMENIYFSTNRPELIQTKHKVPKVGEKITLYFYLFLQCHWINENDCILELIGDLYSKENHNTRNYLQITKSEFVRLESNLPGTILLQSTKTYGDFVKEINILHKGSFKFIKPIMSSSGDMVMKTREFVYNIMEIKKNINPVHKIVVEANLAKYYDNMISVSKKIRREFSEGKKKIISLENLRPEILILKQKLKEKMVDLADSEEFEKANYIKSDINFIDNKIKFIDDLEEKNITQEEYFKTFCLKS